MKTTIVIFVTRSYLPLKTVLLCLLCSLVVSACATPTPTATPTATPIPIPVPTIVPGRACELSPGATIPLAVTGVPGTNVVYSWSATAGIVIPPDGPTVTYTAPNMAGDVIIRVVAQIGSQTSTGIINCKVVATPTPNPTVTYTPSPTATHTPSPTATSTPTPSRTPIPTTPPPPLCEGSTSSDLIGKAWAGTPEVRLACTQLIIAGSTGAADKQQAERVNSGCTVTPDPKDTKAVEKFIASYWAVNDVGTAWFLRGEALTSLGRTTEAKEAYRTVIDKYSCAYAWDSHGWFWSVADAARK
jgi:hypothetical protein